MVYCNECGKKITVDAKFCNKCGKKLHEDKEKHIVKKEIHKHEEPKDEKKDIKKKKFPILLMFTLVIVAIATIVIFTVPISGTAIEVSSEVVPYETQEAYTVQEPYTVYVDKELAYAVLTATNFGNLDGFNWMTYGQLTIKNMDEIPGRFIINCYFHTLKGTLSDEKSLYLSSGESKTATCSADINFGQDVEFTYNVVEPTTTVPVTKYRDVTKYRTVTKYKLDDKETEVSISATLYEIWTKQVQWYYRVESDIVDIIDGEILVMRSGEHVSAQNSNIMSSTSTTNPASTSLIQQNTKSVEPEITVERLQNIISKSSELRNLGDDTKIVITFFDGNGKDIPDAKFTIYGGERVTDGEISDYDIKLTTGSYYIPQLEASNNICSALNKIPRGDVKVKTQGNKISLMLKYKNLKSCVPF